MAPKNDEKLFFGFFEMFVSEKKCSSKVLGGPGWSKKLREASWKNVHLISCKLDLMVPSYDQKSKKLNDEQSNDCFNVSVKVTTPW